MNDSIRFVQNLGTRAIDARTNGARTSSRFRILCNYFVLKFCVCMRIPML